MSILYSNGKVRTPQGMKVAPQSYAKLEQVADGVRGFLPRMAGSKHKLDCGKILEQTLLQAGYNFKIAELEDLDECAAFTIPERELIVIRADIYDDLCNNGSFGRSTVVHEMAHIVLEHHVTLHRGACLGQHKFYEDSEWQAKALTAAIMMPLEVCKEVADAAELAQECGTSFQAATFRLDNLKKYGHLKGQRTLFNGNFQ